MRKLYLFLAISLLLISLVQAEDITLKFTSPSEKDFSGYIMTITAQDQVYKQILEKSEFTIDNNDSQIITVTLNSFKTPTPDFYAETTLKNKDKTILLSQIGYLQGSVLDKQGNLIPYAELKINCLSSAQVKYPQKSDSTGFFSVPNIPAGDCTIITSKGKAVGRSEFSIIQGNALDVEVILEKPLADDTAILNLLLIIFIIVIFGLVLGWFILKAKKKPKKEDKNHSSQTQTIMTTLSEKEKKVADFLLENNNSSSQSRIRHATKIPRTSLSRVFDKLEAKKVIEIEKEGKMVSIKLTPFFLGE